jgi:TPP-dependent indolepyruvate ferredoxin oxidoreductase alpha subunit
LAGAKSSRESPEHARLEDEKLLAAQALANSEELASKDAIRAVMMMKHEALNVAFDAAAPAAVQGPAMALAMAVAW